MSTPTFEEERNVQNHATQWSYLRVRMTVPGQPHDLRIDLARHPKLHAEGHWDISMVGRAKGSGYHPEEVAAQNAFGPRQVRALATHLKTTYGIKSVSGHRVSGARQKANATEKDVRVDLGKGLRLAAHQPFPVQAGANTKAPDDWHHEGTSENPMNPRKRVIAKKPTWVEGPTKIGTYELSEDRARMNHYHVHEIQAVTRGGGQVAMQHLTRMADRHGVSLQLFAEPLKPQGEGLKMTRSKLRSWYQSHGFRPRQGDLMVRTPTKLEKSMPSTNHDIRTVVNQTGKNGQQDLVVRMTHAQTGKTFDTHLSRDASSPEGHWQAVDASQFHSKGWTPGKTPIMNGGSTGVGDFGPSGVRQIAQHLRKLHGVTKVTARTAQASPDGAVKMTERTMMKSVNSPFAPLYERLEKAEFFWKRPVRFGSTKNPNNERASDGTTNTTMMRDGKAKAIKTGEVKADKVPVAARGSVRKVSTPIVGPDFTPNRRGDMQHAAFASDTNAAMASGALKLKERADGQGGKLTMMRDGSVQRIQLFAKALLARLTKLQQLQKGPKPFTSTHGDYELSSQVNWGQRKEGNRLIAEDTITGAIKHKDGSHGVELELTRDGANERPKVWQVSAHPMKGTQRNQIGAGPMKALVDHIRSNHPEVEHVESYGNRAGRNNGVKKVGVN